MSFSVTSTQAGQHAKPTFWGIVRGEFFKVSRLWIVWIMLLLLLGAFCLPYIVTLTVPDLKTTLQTASESFFTRRAEANLAVIRVFGGIFLLILTAYLFGQEYQLGTIRILLARGVGRLQLFAAKLFTLTLIALTILGLGLIVDAMLSCALVAFVTGNLRAFHVLGPAFWTDMRLYIVTIMISMGVTILLATALSVLGRSLAFALGGSLAWFPADNLRVVFLALGYRLTHSDFWLNVSGYLLGPVLNVMPQALISEQATIIGITPGVKVDASHALLVTAVYALVFAVVAIVLVWRRDVKE